jgi:hypothetical protein
MTIVKLMISVFKIQRFFVLKKKQIDYTYLRAYPSSVLNHRRAVSGSSILKLIKVSLLFGMSNTSSAFIFSSAVTFIDLRIEMHLMMEKSLP